MNVENNPAGKNIVWSESLVSAQDRERLLRQKGCVLWLTGLSGSGKSTVARMLEKKLFKSGRPTYILDGDNIRHGLCSDLGFSEDDRKENIRRIGETARLFADAGMIAITAFISPFRSDRMSVREKFPSGRFIEIYMKAPLDVCENRDPKGLYKKARNGEIQEFTGISSPYEEPENPEMVLDTDKRNVAECCDEILKYLEEKQFLTG